MVLKRTPQTLRNDPSPVGSEDRLRSAFDHTEFEVFETNCPSARGTTAFAGLIGHIDARCAFDRCQSLDPQKCIRANFLSNHPQNGLTRVDWHQINWRFSVRMRHIEFGWTVP
ncbi:hypothetical protein TWF106_008768 [Orbilia oligospora]|uniref:Uncharacterized protein n=1 Tax=Orbilia oligospora TaxID=2813651 RepID=A0A6G1LS14_ORBOL|nr:hypothetical protein TWF788_005333 [Orbilia oligospora]KAF3196751.1 hypothetical protein TWF191_006463 [Orbilia oligospora]KAF3200728.1 hypothetical protein TWF679_000633 [Orbilia oligospora]KAF3215261.1 hypothetical protein TWF106_008768 [Orbilia oligospora]KAF3231454.1 hypothetical protein TWF192_003605 [Orbilia oligospora]